MKKSIFILILSVIFLFSNCDPVLEALFPNATIGGNPEGDGNTDLGSNTIHIRVRIDDPLIYEDGMFYNSSIRVILERWDDIEGAWYYERDWQEQGLSVFEVFFEPLPGGIYRAVVYWDMNNDWQCESGEPNTLAWSTNDGNTDVYLPFPPDPPSWVDMDAGLWYYDDALGLSW